MTAKQPPWLEMQVPAEGLVMRRCLAEHPLDAFWAVNPEGKRLFAVAVPKIKGIALRPEVNLSPLPLNFARIKDGKDYWIIGPCEVTGSDILGKVGTDLLDASMEKDIVRSWELFRSRLRIWAGFFKAGIGILDENEKRGLFGELLEIQSLLEQGITSQVTIQGWTGPAGGQHDFALEKRLIEVKTLLDPHRGKVRISSEDQLDDSGGSLQLAVKHVMPSMKGISLNKLASTVESMLDPGSKMLFNDLLKLAGYIPLEAYDQPTLLLLREDRYNVGKDFPRLVKDILPLGISKVAYDLELSSISKWLETGE